MGYKDKRGRYLAKNTLGFALGTLGTKAITIFLVPVYTYALTTEQYGVVDMITAICAMLGPVVTLNIAEAAMRFCLDQDADRDRVISTSLVVFVSGLVVGLVLIPVCHQIGMLSEYAVYIYFYMLSMTSSQMFLSCLRGQERIKLFSLGNILQAFTAAGLNILFLLVFHWEIKGYLLAYIIASFVVTAYALAALRIDRVIRNWSVDIELMKKMTRFSAVLIPNAFLWWIMNSSDRIMVTSMLGSSANGIYAVAYKIPTAMNMLAVSFNQAWSYSAIREKGSSDEEAYHNRVYNGIASALIIVCGILLAVSKPFLRIYVQEDYFSAWKYMPYLIIGFMFLTLASFLSTIYTVHKDSLAFLLSALLGAAVNVLLNVILIPMMGIAGAALATCSSYIAVFVFRAIHSRKYIKINVLRKPHLIGYALLAGMGASMYLNGIFGDLLPIPFLAGILFVQRKELKMIMSKGAVLLKSWIRR